MREVRHAPAVAPWDRTGAASRMRIEEVARSIVARTIDPGLAELRGLVSRMGSLARTILAKALRGFANDPSALDKYSAAALAFSAREGRLHHATTRWHQLLTGKPLANPSAPTPL